MHCHIYNLCCECDQSNLFLNNYFILVVANKHSFMTNNFLFGIVSLLQRIYEYMTIFLILRFFMNVMMKIVSLQIILSMKIQSLFVMFFQTDIYVSFLLLSLSFLSTSFRVCNIERMKIKFQRKHSFSGVFKSCVVEKILVK